MKRLISLALTVLMLLSVVNIASFSTFAATTEVITSGEFKYGILDDGTVQVVGYIGNKKAIEIPYTIDGYSVTSIGGGLFYNKDYESAKIPASVTNLKNSLFECCYYMQRVDVDENNPLFCSVDGVVFDKSMENLIYYPHSKPDEIYTIPDGVVNIEYDGLYGRAIRGLIIPASLKSVCHWGLFTNFELAHCYYAGTKEQWQQIAFHEFDDHIPSVHYNNTTGLVFSEVVAPTCTEQGYSVYVCSEPDCTKKRYVEYTDALGHNYTVDKTIAPTCTEQGYRSRVCSVCDYEEKTEYKDALGHTEVIDEAVAKTCTTSGLTQGKHCSVCNEVLIEQKVIDASHEWTEWQIVEVKQDCKDGLLARMCNDCYDMEKQTIPADEPHTEVIDEAVPPTYTETGLTEGKHCSVCNKVLVEQQVIDKLTPEEDTPSFIYGDVNGDGKVNINDATAIQRYIAKKITLTENQLFSADFDGNSYISVNDCTAIQKQLVKLETDIQRKDIPVISGTAPEETGTAIAFNVEKNKNDHSEHSYGYGYASGYGEYTAVISSYEEYAQVIENPYPEYDQEFFRENSLIFLYRWTSSGSYRYSINSLSLKDKTLYMKVDLNIPDGAVTDDIGNWNIYVSVKKSDIANAEKLYIF